ncbi:MAG TPA: methyltransferase [Planctomycetota bacterium]|nr:methyltransferase [Planctomycetota bacterium]
MPEADSPAEYLLQVLGGKCRAQAVSTAAALGLADHLAAGPRSIASLAEVTGCDAAVLVSVLRVCAGLGFFDSPSPDTFALTPRGTALQRDSLGALAEFVGSPEQWNPWSALRESARDGGTAFARTHGAGLYEHLARTPAAAARYDAAIDAFTRHEAEALCGRFSFGGARSVVDLGGGRGSLLAEVLQRWPHLRAVLFDLPHVVERAMPELRRRFGERVTGHGGDFFGEVPNGHDAYLVKHVLHNWDDDRAQALLRRCAGAMADGGRVLAIETVLAPDNRADLAAMMDLEMQVLLGGRVRRKPELRRLFQAAGLRVEQMVPLVGGSWLLAGVRADDGSGDRAPDRART